MNLRDLDGAKWGKTIWSIPFTGWYSAPLLGKEFTDIVTDDGIATSKSNLKQEQTLGAWTMDCAYTEATVRLSIAARNVQ